MKPAGLAEGGKVAGVSCAAGISFWKRRRVAELLGGAPAFADDATSCVRQAQARGGAVAVWPSRAPPGLDRAAAAAGVPVWRMEDGFIRSRGLGANFVPPASIVIDRRGAHYDPRQPSDLETLLAGHGFDAQLLARARRLITLLTERRVTKYNLDEGAATLPDAAGRRRVLVPGQVEDDASVRLGGAGAGAGLDLLARVRHAAPGAFIVYKPHPDVEAGHRPGHVADRDALRWADAVVRDRSILALIGWADEVHVLTSLAGFEALLRGRPVTAHGQPFYAGWGLTTDLNPIPRRRRRLTLEQLVAAALILYPLYVDPTTGLRCGPEQLVARLSEPPRRPAPLVGLRRAQGRVRSALNAVMAAG